MDQPDSAGVGPLSGFSPERRASVLIETLPYIQRFAGSIIVV